MLPTLRSLGGQTLQQPGGWFKDRIPQRMTALQKDLFTAKHTKNAKNFTVCMHGSSTFSRRLSRIPLSTWCHFDTPFSHSTSLCGGKSLFRRLTDVHEFYLFGSQQLCSEPALSVGKGCPWWWVKKHSLR